MIDTRVEGTVVRVVVLVDFERAAIKAAARATPNIKPASKAASKKGHKHGQPLR